MRKNYLSVSLLIIAIFAMSQGWRCYGQDAALSHTSSGAARQQYNGWPENFETGIKASYVEGPVSQSTGIWILSSARVGMSAGDRRNGNKSIRIMSTGKVTMNFDLPKGASQVTIVHGMYGSDAPSTWQLWYSTNSGNTWAAAGNIVTTSTTSLCATSFPVNVRGNVRFQLRKLSGGRLNIDDFGVAPYSSALNKADTVPTRDDNMAMGNPSGAKHEPTEMNNYLLVKSQYAMSYNNAQGMPNWVSWHLSKAWKGSADRSNHFAKDTTLPASFFKVIPSHYTGVGFDRGHLCPSDDRDGSDSDNEATFKMSNMSPQSPHLNERTWEYLEAYSRTLTAEGNELYIIAGGYGTGGTGSKGGITKTIANGAINVPSHFWKVIVVLPVGADDVNRVTTATRVIAVDMPNNQVVNEQPWYFYRTSVDAIEAATGYNFLSNVPANIQKVIESHVDTVQVH